MDTLPSEATFWSWAIRGLGGSVSILEGMLKHGPRLTESQHHELEALTDRLVDLGTAAYGRRIDKGADSHGTDTDPLINTGRQPNPFAVDGVAADHGGQRTGRAGSDCAASADTAADGGTD